MDKLSENRMGILTSDMLETFGLNFSQCPESGQTDPLLDLAAVVSTDTVLVK